MNAHLEGSPDHSVTALDSGHIQQVIESTPKAVTAILTAAAFVSIAISIYALGRAENATDQARIMERETRIMQDDLKYIRAYLSARGIEVPANHEESEGK